MNAIEVRGLTKSFDDVLAVDDLTFEIPAGRVTGFLGPNGAGKSTTLRTILGLLRPDRGTTAVFGQPFSSLPDPARTVGALLDAEQFHPQRSGRNHLRVLATAGGIPARRVDEVLEAVDLTAAANRKAGGYSLGMKQRLGLAAALLGDPRVLVLDEPANGLDPAGIRWLRTFLEDFASGDRAVFVSSHQLAQMAEMAGDVVVVDKGRLVTHAPVHDLVGRTAPRVRVVTPQPERLTDLLDARGIQFERLSAEGLRVSAGGEVVGTLANDSSIPLFALTPEESSLEDVFFELTDDRSPRRAATDDDRENERRA